MSSMFAMIQLPIEYYEYSGLLNFICCGACAVVLLYKAPRSLSARRLAYLSLVVTCWAGFYYLWLRTTDAFLAEYLVRTLLIPVAFAPSAFLHFVSALTGRLRNALLHVANYTLSLLISSMVYTPSLCLGVEHQLVFPYWPIAGPLYAVHMVHALSLVGIAFWVILSEALRSEGTDRLRLWWTFWSMGIGFVSAYSNYFLLYRIQIPPVLTPFTSLYVIGITYAVVKHRLIDIQVIIRRSFVYSLLIATMTATYLLVVLVTERWFQGFFGYRSLVATLVVAFVIAIFFNPLREKIQAFVDRAILQATPAELATQREQLLEEVRKGDQMKAVATLAAGLAHEIKNPLTSIKTFTEHLNARHDDPGFREKFQKIVGGEVERINLIVQQLLEFAKPVPPKLAPTDASKTLEDTLALLNNELLARHVSVIKSFTPTPPILADPQQLKQVFLNLLLNSLQAMNGDGTLTLRTFPKDGELVMVLEDSGCGVAPEDLKRLGEPFFSTKPTGTGLGLAVVQSIIREHQGKFQITSQVGNGTRVEIRLPLASTS